MKIVKSLEKSGLLIKRVRETIENESKDKKDGFFDQHTNGGYWHILSPKNHTRKIDKIHKDF